MTDPTRRNDITMSLSLTPRGQTDRTRHLQRVPGLVTSSKLLAVGLITAIALSACSSSTSSKKASSTTKPHTATSIATTTSAVASGHATVDTAHSALFGTILVNSSGMTLYMLTADTSTTSACTAACQAVWPPLTVTGAPTAGPGVNPSLLGTIPGPNGMRQVTYGGHPLYTFAKDTAAGQVNGEGINHFGGFWYVLNPAGNPVETAIGATTSTPAASSHPAAY
jgi:predicted lipoprotein with Yx(FWY)xxD motif